MNFDGSDQRHRRQGLQKSGAWVVPISQVTVSIPTTDANHTFAAVRKEVLQWMAQRAGRPLPTAAWQGHAFELEDVGSQRAAAAVLDQPSYWAARADDADRVVPKRTWATEFGLAIASPTELRFGCRLQCVSQGELSPVGYSVPTVVRQVVHRFGATVDGWPVTGYPRIVETESDAWDLARLLVNRARYRPVIAVAVRDAAATKKVGDAASAASRISERTLGLAHVVVVGDHASYSLTSQFGKEFSVFNGAVRTYRPGFDPEHDEPGQHPVAFLDSITTWSEGGIRGFEEFLVRQAFRLSVSSRHLEIDLPAFTTIRQLSIRRRRDSVTAHGGSDTDLLALALEENESLRRQLEDEKRTHEGLLEAAEDERDDTVISLDTARGENRRLRARLDHLVSVLDAKGRTADAPLPHSFDALDEWANQHLAGAVHLTNRAMRAARKSEFSDPSLAYNALLVLRDFYVPMRRGQVTREEYQNALAALGLEDTSSFAGVRSGQFGDEYFVTYNGRRRELDRHLKGSSSRDERFGFRLYYFWDEEAGQVVVGWLPSHLTTDIT